MTEHCHLYSSLIDPLSLSLNFAQNQNPNVSNNSSLKPICLSLKPMGLSLSLSLFVSLSLSRSDQCPSLKDRCFTPFFAQINVSLSLFLPHSSMLVMVSVCGSGGQLGLAMSRGYGSGSQLGGELWGGFVDCLVLVLWGPFLVGLGCLLR